MKICEIFASIQGESSFTGFPCIFVRLTGCNLRCSYCDTTYAYEEGTDMQLRDIVHKVVSSGLQLVTITGGEPLLQQETILLIKTMLEKGYTVLIETNGSVDISKVDKGAHIILDIKTPSSNMGDRIHLKNLEYVGKKDDVKFVLCSREDYEWSKTFIEKNSLIEKTNVLFSPAFGILEPALLCQWMIEDRINARLNLQIHKYIFGPEERGV